MRKSHKSFTNTKFKNSNWYSKRIIAKFNDLLNENNDENQTKICDFVLSHLYGFLQKDQRY